MNEGRAKGRNMKEEKIQLGMNEMRIKRRKGRRNEDRTECQNGNIE